VASDGTLIPTRAAIALADQAEIYWTALTSTGIPLRLGRTRRIATAGQTAALTARDHGCSFPGCDTAPERCERHHIIGWADGGATDPDNLTLLCRYHHHNFANKGWDCAINPPRTPRMATTLVDRPRPPTTHQQPDPQRTRRRVNPPTPVAGLTHGLRNMLEHRLPIP
jgi:hypothetical protein